MKRETGVEMSRWVDEGQIALFWKGGRGTKYL